MWVGELRHFLPNPLHVRGSANFLPVVSWVPIFGRICNFWLILVARRKTDLARILPYLTVAYLVLHSQARIDATPSSLPLGQDL